MTGDEDTVGGKIQTTISFVVTRIPKKYTEARSRGELVGGSARHVWVAGASEDTEVGVRRVRPEQGEVGSAVGQGLGG